jgi:hypothetical protein
VWSEYSFGRPSTTVVRTARKQTVCGSRVKQLSEGPFDEFFVGSLTFYPTTACIIFALAKYTDGDRMRIDLMVSTSNFTDFTVAQMKFDEQLRSNSPKRSVDYQEY